MAKIFGVDIRKIVGQAAGGSNLPPLTLIKFTPGQRDPANLAGGRNSTESSFAGRGVIETVGGRESRHVEEGTDAVVTVIADSLGPESIFPAVNDMIEIEGIRYRILSVSTDPAKAHHSCNVAAQ